MSKESTNTTGIDESILNFVNNIYEQSIADGKYNTLNIDSECHGCSGKGWIENSKGDLKICPICEGEGKLNKEKDCVEKEKRDNLPCYPWYPYPSRIDSPYWSIYPIVTYYNVKTDDCTNCCNQK